jgi:hypothetical protein
MKMLRQLLDRKTAVTQANSVSVYAFDPFGGSLVNSAQTLMHKAQLPFTPVEVGLEGVRNAIREQVRDKRRVLWLGQGNDTMVVENVAHNDFEGKPIASGAGSSLTNPLQLIVPGLTQGIDAGNYYCNMALWEMLRNGVEGVFVHVPRKVQSDDITTLHKIIDAIMK